MHKVFCWMQIVSFFLIAVYAGVFLFFPHEFSSSTFAERDVSYEEYIERLNNGTTDWQRYNAASALGEIGNRAAIPHLINSLRDKSPSVRLNSIHSLGELKATNAIDDIKLLLTDSSEDVRKSAGYVIKELESVESVPGQQDVFYCILILAPAIIILFSLGVKLVFYLKYKSSRLVQGVTYIAWPLGVFFAWFSQRPYQINETRMVVGFPFEAVVFQYESGDWVDYVSSLTMPLLTFDMLYALFLPQVLIAIILFIVYGIDRKKGLPDKLN